MKIIISLFFLVCPIFSHAVVIGGSNLGFSGYPEFSEVEPSAPYSDDKYSWENYQREVEDYTEKAKQYLEDSNSDIQRVQEAQQDAIQKANSVVEEYNRNVRR